MFINISLLGNSTIFIFIIFRMSSEQVFIIGGTGTIVTKFVVISLTIVLL